MQSCSCPHTRSINATGRTSKPAQGVQSGPRSAGPPEGETKTRAAGPGRARPGQAVPGKPGPGQGRARQAGPGKARAGTHLQKVAVMWSSRDTRYIPRSWSRSPLLGTE